MRNKYISLTFFSFPGNTESFFTREEATERVHQKVTGGDRKKVVGETAKADEREP